MWTASCSLPSPAIVAINDKLSISQLPRARRSNFSVSVASISKPDNSDIRVSQPELSRLSSSSAVPAPPFVNAIQNPPEMALLSLLFVLSMVFPIQIFSLVSIYRIKYTSFLFWLQAIGAIFSLAVISIPTMIALKKLAVSANELSKIVSEEVPGTLSSLKLSSLEINELTQQLSNLRFRVVNMPRKAEAITPVLPPAGTTQL
ncbi:PAB-dependent poly(A)-specific ribonuclease subunit PAN3 [Melia azedarach]|uniref:PAB-dependent poly(A)-specific ribonuclease subunit PAN3 n=1 Tax=Melia azedarach TaxID=155640 RepID=A0ACC1YGV9_MELAZ|nr:PAB-dependent poly(A)-specific ribonuclease subunit PAN3 [Melia azedarach]